MKKMLFALLACGLLSSSLFAWYEGTVGQVKVTSSAVSLTLDREGASSIRRDFSGDAETIKRFIAIALTAKASDATVRVDYVGGKFTTITIK
jgi:hypothetical protein